MTRQLTPAIMGVSPLLLEQLDSRFPSMSSTWIIFSKGVHLTHVAPTLNLASGTGVRSEQMFQRDPSRPWFYRAVEPYDDVSSSLEDEKTQNTCCRSSTTGFR